MEIYGTFWSLIPSLVAIALALITKEVYSSLAAGVIVAGLLHARFSVVGSVKHIYSNGIVAVVTDDYHVGILIFLIVLGAMVCLMNRAGGTAAFGIWASKHIKSRVGVQLVTIALGCMIFIDDYFNCLTVGSVMRPVTDKHKVSRAKLSYLIDSTAAPICIIAPISSWAAAVASYVESDNGFKIFIRSIPYNFYALLTIFMMIVIVVRKKDYGPMKVHEMNALSGDLYTVGECPYEDTANESVASKGDVIELVIPILALIVCCVIGMIHTGGFFRGVNFITAFSNCDADVGLAVGGIGALLITIVVYLFRRVMTFSDCMACIPDGFKSMVPAILILIFAWSLKTMTDSLGAAVFVENVVNSVVGNFSSFLPAIIFVVGVVIAFATGTSWGTFGILIPIVYAVFEGVNPELMIISISACMAGAVCGDHCSPISDTTIMASTGAQCNHVNHVSTQLPYALTVAAVSFVTYIIAGFVQNPWISLLVGVVLLIGIQKHVS